MTAVRMDGTALAAEVKARVLARTEGMRQKPGLAVVLAGDNPASRVYLSGKRKDCAQCGIYSEEYTLPAEATQAELLDLIDVLNGREDIDGILLQIPLPGHLDQSAALQAIRPDKDVDCAHPYNMGQLTLGAPAFSPCTPAGVMRLLDEYGIDPAGKTCVIVGRSNIVGKPLALMMLSRHATVTLCHTRTPDLRAECLRADLLVAAAGREGLITGDMVKEGAVVVDVAMNRNREGKLCGDVDSRRIQEKASFYTPVPGGVGPMTRAMLMENTLQAALAHGKS